MPTRIVKRSAVVDLTQQEITPLLRFLRALLDTSMRRQFAEDCGTTLFYLYQLAADPEPNPRLVLAKAICTLSRVYAPKVMTSPLTYDDLLIGQLPRTEPSGDSGPDGAVEAERGEGEVLSTPGRRARKKA